jgi:hypothetical protein
MSEQKCENCQFWQPPVNTSDTKFGECHRRAPFAYHTPYHPTQFPEVRFDNWCGDWNGNLIN